MIKLSQSTAIALHALIYIANRGDQVIPLNEIADTFKISANHLSKVLQRLVKADYLISIKGPKGGFKIVDQAKYITFMDVYEIIEGRKTQCTCLFPLKRKECRNCIMRGLIGKLNQDFYKYMTDNKIIDFKL